MENSKVEKLDSFIWWKKRQKKRWLECGIFTLLMEIFVGVIMFSNPSPDEPVKDYIFGIIGFVGFSLVVVYCLWCWIKLCFVKVDSSFNGIVTEKRRYSRNSKSKRNDDKAYYVIARNAGEEMEGKCDFEFYRQLSAGDPVIIFTIGTDEKFAIPLFEKS